jgi:hypothetical protein
MSEDIGRTKHSFSSQHLYAARYFANRAHEIENSKLFDQTLNNIHRAYVVGAIISIVACLESSINELYLDAVNGILVFKDDQEPYIRSDHKINKTIALYWEDGEIESKSIKLKYQTVLLIINGEICDKGSQPFQDFDNLLKLRNSLVHYKPEWHDERTDHQKLKERLASKFQSNPFGRGSALWFPHQCLGSGCALWAVTVGEEFLKDFFSKIGIHKSRWYIFGEEPSTTMA